MDYSRLVRLEDRLYIINLQIENAKNAENIDYNRDIKPLEIERRDVRKQIEDEKNRLGKGWQKAQR